MKKGKQLLALLGVIVLVGLYLSTIVCALFAGDNFMDMLMASVYATIIIPVLIWAYTLIYKLVKKKDDENEDDKNIEK